MGVLSRFAIVAAASSASGALASDDARTSPAVAKVIEMMEGLKEKITNEGKEEAKTFGKFETWCTDTKEEKDTAVTENTDGKETLEANLKTWEAAKVNLAADIEKFTTEIAETETSIKEGAQARKEEKAAYTKSAAEMQKAVSSLDKAVEVLKASKVSLIQMESIKQTVKAAAALLGKDAPVEDYGFHSGGVIETLEGLQEDARKTKFDADEAEIAAEGAFQKADLALKQTLQTKNEELKTAEANKAMKTKQLGEGKVELASTTKELEDDTKYLAEITEMCDGKKKTYDQRVAQREEEQAALTEAVTIMSDKPSGKAGMLIEVAQAAAQDPVVLAAADHEASIEAVPRKASAMSFLQRREVSAKPVDAQREALIAMLYGKAKLVANPRSFLSVAQKAEAGGPLEEIKKMIVQQIDALQAKAAASQDSKGSCDKRIAEGGQKRDQAATQVSLLNKELAATQARAEKFKDHLASLKAEMDSLAAQKEDSTKMRDDEAAEAKVAIDEAIQAKAATESAIQVLSNYYAKAQNNQAPVSLAAAKAAQKPPDAGFKNSEAYKGSQGASTGIIGMLDVIKSDFARTVQETEDSEKAAVKEHNKLLEEIEVSVASKEMSTEQETKFKDEAEEKISEDQTSLESQITTLKTALAELSALETECGNGVKFEERKANREAEIDSLKDAIEFVNRFISAQNAR